LRHELKILPQHFTPVLDELKTAELRKNDRNFTAGDTLILMEWNGDYTGDACERVVTHVADVGDYLPGYVLLSMAPPNSLTDTFRQIENDGWIEWGGSGECPVHDDVDCVEIKIRGGLKFKIIPGDRSWLHYGNQYDIIAYRIV